MPWKYPPGLGQGSQQAANIGGGSINRVDPTFSGGQQMQPWRPQNWQSYMNGGPVIQAQAFGGGMPGLGQSSSPGWGGYRPQFINGVGVRAGAASHGGYSPRPQAPAYTGLPQQGYGQSGSAANFQNYNNGPLNTIGSSQMQQQLGGLAAQGLPVAGMGNVRPVQYGPSASQTMTPSGLNMMGQQFSQQGLQSAIAQDAANGVSNTPRFGTFQIGDTPNQFGGWNASTPSAATQQMPQWQMPANTMSGNPYIGGSAIGQQMGWGRGAGR